MDNVTLTARDFLSSLTNGHAANDLEWAMVGIFTEIVQELQIDQLNDIYNYGAPWQGSRTVVVVERFTKLKPRFSQRHLTNILISNLCYRPYMNRLR